METIYLDYNATTPVDPRVAEAMIRQIRENFGNPSSMHEYGYMARKTVEEARSEVAQMIGAREDEIVFTAGGSESNNMALKGMALVLSGKGNHIITTSVEHPAITEVCRFLERTGFSVTRVPVDGFGMVDPDDIRKALNPSTILVSVMHANNEVGTIQPVEEIGRITREAGVVFHCDAAQSAGKIPVTVDAMGVDLLSLAGHKFYAPKGIGVLYVRRGLHPVSLVHGAGHESGRRAGTENVVHIAGIGKAASLANHLAEGHEAEYKRLIALRDMLHDGIRTAIPEARLNGHPLQRLPNTLSVGFPGIEAPLLLQAMKSVAASAGAACHADHTEISEVLLAMQVPRRFAVGTIRYSVGRMTKEDEIARAIPVIAGAWRKLAGSVSFTVFQPGDSDLGAEKQLKSSYEGFMFPPGNGIEDALVHNNPGKNDSPVKEVPGHQPEKVHLTQYTHALGCACKIRPQLLERILRDHIVPAGWPLLVGNDTSDDAAVYALNSGEAIVQTIDVIPPVVDDPYAYGAIAAANAISDIYAMGGNPLFALSFVGFPDRLLPVEVLRLIMQGAADKAAEAGIRIVGGHTIEDQEPKFGLVVTGLVNPERVLRNSTARAGDALVLTKPLGTGIIMTAAKRGLTHAHEVEEATRVMSGLNRVAAKVMAAFPVNACTDVTGFGLLGHLKEMATGAGLTAEIIASEVPVLGPSMKHAAAGSIPGGTVNNRAFAEGIVIWGKEIPEMMKYVLCDAQTSGGLLISLPSEFAESLVGQLHREEITEAAVIGSFTEGGPAIRVI